MLQLIVGAALGFILAQCALYCLGQLVGWLRRAGLRDRIRRLRPVRLPALTSGFIRSAGVVAGGVAIIALAAWTVADFLSSRSAHGATAAAVADAAAVAPDADGTADEVAGLVPAPPSEAVPEGQVAAADPYRDADFKVERRPHRAGTAPSLKETLLERSEAKARADLLSETELHAHRSQYDCEAAVRAGKYLAAGLDVWGFAAWQLKYFPTAGYKGATLPQCKGLKDVIDPASLSAQSALSSENHS